VQNIGLGHGVLCSLLLLFGMWVYDYVGVSGAFGGVFFY
jgi:hypothetical protein